MKTKLFFIILLYGAMQQPAFSQGSLPLSVIGAAGTVLEKDGYTLGFTVGEVATLAYSNNIYQIREGFWQIYEVFVLVVEVEGVQAEIAVFPNPYEDALQLKISGSLSKPLEILIFDMSSRLLLTEKIQPAETVLIKGSCALPAGIYFLSICSEKGELLGSVKVSKVR